jgi:hypothetical protein
MNTWAAPGVQCVCISDHFEGGASCDGYSVPTRIPMLNEVLTISVMKIRNGELFLGFEEIPLDQSDGPLTGHCILFNVACFRPLEKRKTDISIFTKLLMPAGRIPVDA